MTPEMYSIMEISEMSNLSIGAIKDRIKRLEIFPDGMKGKARLFNQEKTQCILSQIKYYKPTQWAIYESKMNFE